ncbi:MAG: hypothetical protein ACI84S_000920 [Thalassomonas sp.]|jgi:hypothetical protein
MKILLSILSVFLLACTSPKTEIPTDILSETTFTNILKEVHLAEATFELHKTKGMENAKNELAHNYSTIYKTHEITGDDFDKTLDYYAQHPEQLEKIYTSVLEELSKERTTLNQK